MLGSSSKHSGTTKGLLWLDPELLLYVVGASQEEERGDDEHGDAEQSGEVLRERHGLSSLEDVVEEEEIHQQEPDDESDSECVLHVPSLLRRLGHAPEQSRDTLVRRERGSPPPSRPILHELATGRVRLSSRTHRVRRLHSALGDQQRRQPGFQLQPIGGPEAISGPGRTFGVRSFPTRSRSRLAQSKLTPMRLVPTGLGPSRWAPMRCPLMLVPSSWEASRPSR